MTPPFRVVALLSVRNEEAYIERCIRHLFSQGIETCLIDNESTDRTLDIAHRLRHLGIFRIETQPYKGFFSLEDQCRLQEQLADDIEADWFIHQDADEIRESDNPSQTLLEALFEIDQSGCNAAKFDEFVFVPTDASEAGRSLDYVMALQFYYFFKPRLDHRVNAWKKLPGVKAQLVSSGGHDVQFCGRRLSDRSLVLRHYIVLSAKHASEKYGVQRVFSPEELTLRGWHRARDTWKTMRFRFPDPSELKRYSSDQPFDRSDPKIQHLFWSPQ